MVVSFIGKDYVTLTQKETQMESLRKYAKNRWVWVIALALAALASGEAFSGGQFSQILLVLMGQ